MKDFYKILQIQPSATEEEIKIAYRKLAHQHHPDKGGSEDKFKEINEAYQILSDKYQRGAYDATIFIMRQSVAYSSTTKESTVKDSNVVRNAVILFLIGIGFWWWNGDNTDINVKLLLGWAFVIGAVVVYRRGKNAEAKKAYSKIVEEVQKNQTDADTQPFQKDKKNTYDSTQEGVKIIPLENLGLSGFVLEYCWNMSLLERNKTILSVFPKIFWDELGVSFEDVLAHADILCDKRINLTIERQKKKDEWLVKYGHKIALAMEKITAKDGAFQCRSNSVLENGVWVNKDDEEHQTFLKKVGDIKQAELQLLGMYLLSLLPIEDQKKFYEKVYQSDKYAYLLKLWAEIICFPFLKQHGSLEKKGVETRTYFGEITDKYGFVGAISWIRNISNEYEIEDYIKNYSIVHFGKDD